jgi:hypothetical protein
MFSVDWVEKLFAIAARNLMQLFDFIMQLSLRKGYSVL